MEKLVNYRNWIKSLLSNYVQEGRTDRSDIEDQLIFDTDHDHYQVLSVGWEKGQRVFFCVLHLDIKNDKIWLQENSTDYDIAEDLMALGVPASDIVIGFIPLDARALSEYAVA